MFELNISKVTSKKCILLFVGKCYPVTLAQKESGEILQVFKGLFLRWVRFQMYSSLFFINSQIYISMCKEIESKSFKGLIFC